MPIPTYAVYVEGRYMRELKSMDKKCARFGSTRRTEAEGRSEGPARNCATLEEDLGSRRSRPARKKYPLLTQVESVLAVAYCRDIFRLRAPT